MPDDAITLRPSAVHLLLLQRSQYRGPLESLCKRLRCRDLYDRFLIRWAEPLRARRIAELYAEELRADYEQIRPVLPARAEAILDVGCGLGGIDIMLARHYASCAVELWMLDYDRLDDRVYFGFHDRTAAYSSMAATRALLEDNGVAPERIRLRDVERDGWPGGRRFDVIVSLISWGFHYPVETYLEQAAASLSPGGVLILDIRDDTGGAETLRGRFGSVEVLHRAAKHSRLAASEPLPNA